ncbi:MAG TPA: protein kinase [Polyangiaceae bacterium]|jgi:serine/threonine-protein kinase|nr:protein kinase [Polyangiaceae bacterium]
MLKHQGYLAPQWGVPTTERLSAPSQSAEPNWTIPAAGETIAGKYVVEGECGRGGLAVVLSAWHAELDRRVAIKVLLPEWSSDRHIVERFLREGRAATSIQSEHCVQIFDVGALDNGAPFLVLEYLEGQNLDDVVLTKGPLPVPTAIDWLLQAAEAIAEGHALGIVHRDLKPANLFLTQRPDGTASIKVIDFGLSKLTVAGSRGDVERLTQPTDVMGSPSYMAPEQLRASCDADPRTDQWALGAVLYELITAQSPFRGGSMPEICAAVLMQPPATISSLREGIPAAVECAILRCLEKDPDARYGNVAELAAALAPYGSASSRASCESIERVLRATGSAPPMGSRARNLAATFMDPITLPRFPRAARNSDRNSGDSYDVHSAPANPVSGKVILCSFLVLAGLGLAVLLGMYVHVHHKEPGWVSSEIQSVLRLVTPTKVAALAERSTTTPKAASEPRFAAEPKALGEANAKTELIVALSSDGAAPLSQKVLPFHGAAPLIGMATPALRSRPQPQRPTKAQPIDARQRSFGILPKPTLVESSPLERSFPPGEVPSSGTTSAPLDPPTDEIFDTPK